MASSTPSNGLDTANQKETSQPESFAVLFVFTLFSQAFEDGHFTEREISFETGRFHKSSSSFLSQAFEDRYFRKFEISCAILQCQLRP
jgi:hypothetical protein